MPLTPQQHALLDAAAGHGGQQVEQLHWRWHGPVDTGRFTAAWQSVADRETVLRAAFDLGDVPRLLLHEHARVEVVRHPAGTTDFEELKHQDRLRGFDPRTPGLLRLNLLDEGAPPGGPPSVRVLLTFHPVLLDGWSVSVLLQEFYRAYLAGGRLPGGERRPDIRDYARWLARQDTGPARDFWAGTVPAAPAQVLPAVPGPPTGLTGPGRAEARLAARPAGRLRAWAAGRAVTEAGALQAAWALLLYRAARTAGPALVGFGVSVSGRGIALDSVERLPGLLANALPVTVRVDPAGAVAGLLADLRDRALDLAAYEWVSLGQIHRWSGRGPDDSLAQSLIVFENRRPRPDGLHAALAAQGIRVGRPRPAGTGAGAVFPVSLLAQRERDDSLVLAAVHDRARLADDDAARLVGQCVRLLRELPALEGGSATVADALAALADEPPVRMAPAPPRPRTARTARAARAGRARRAFSTRAAPPPAARRPREETCDHDQPAPPGTPARPHPLRAPRTRRLPRAGHPPVRPAGRLMDAGHDLTDAGRELVDAGRELRIGLVGAGPAACPCWSGSAPTNAPAPPRAPVTIHLVDPCRPGAGRVWRTDQSRLLLMNTVACQVTVFTDETVTMDGPVEPGPDLYRWARTVVLPAPPAASSPRSRRSGGTPARHLPHPRLLRRLPRGLLPAHHPPRPRPLPHRRTPRPRRRPARPVRRPRHPADPHPGRRHPADRPGRRGPRPGPPPAAPHGRGTRPHPGSGPPRTDLHPPGQPRRPRPPRRPRGRERAAARTGAELLDTTALLTLGRGGRFTRRSGRLVYLPSGREPRILAGSRRGVPTTRAARTRRAPADGTGPGC